MVILKKELGKKIVNQNFFFFTFPKLPVSIFIIEVQIESLSINGETCNISYVFILNSYIYIVSQNRGRRRSVGKNVIVIFGWTPPLININ